MLIEDGMFKTCPLFIFNCSLKEASKYVWRKYHAEMKHDDDNNCIGTVRHFEGAPWRVVWLKRMSKRPEDVANFVHELTHLVICICEDKGIAVKANFRDGEIADEPVAYMMDFFTRKFFEEL